MPRLSRPVSASFPRLPLLVYLPREDTSHLIRILDAGADDYITSSVGIEEIQARLRALLRSYHLPALLSATAAHLLLQSEDRQIQLDMAEQCVCVQGKIHHLTTKENAILCELMMQSEKIISNVTILQSVWRPTYYHEIDYLRVYRYFVDFVFRLVLSSPDRDNLSSNCSG